MSDRRRFLQGVVIASAGAVVAGCDSISHSAWGSKVLDVEGPVNYRVQGFFAPAGVLAKEYPESAISKVFRANGSTNPQTTEYTALAGNDFKGWKLAVDGLVAHPAQLSIQHLMALAEVTQITRHDCVEGWSVIGKWTGTPLSAVLDHVGVQSGARYVVFHCYDDMGLGTPYYESVDLTEARHPQTLLAYRLNDQPLPIANGAPLRLRLGRQLGYKQAKYIKRVELVASLKNIEGGNGGYWEDQGYAWYAGI